MSEPARWPDDAHDPDRLTSKPLLDCSVAELDDAIKLAEVGASSASFLSGLIEAITGLLDDAGVESLRALPDPDTVLRRVIERQLAELADAPRISFDGAPARGLSLEVALE